MRRGRDERKVLVGASGRRHAGMKKRIAHVKCCDVLEGNGRQLVRGDVQRLGQLNEGIGGPGAFVGFVNGGAAEAFTEMERPRDAISGRFDPAFQ